MPSLKRKKEEKKKNKGVIHCVTINHYGAENENAMLNQVQHILPELKLSWYHKVVFFCDQLIPAYSQFIPHTHHCDLSQLFFSGFRKLERS